MLLLLSADDHGASFDQIAHRPPSRKPHLQTVVPHDHSADHVAGSDDDHGGSGRVLNRWRDPNTYIALGTIGLVVIGLVAAWISRDSERRQKRHEFELRDRLRERRLCRP